MDQVFGLLTSAAETLGTVRRTASSAAARVAVDARVVEDQTEVALRETAVHKSVPATQRADEGERVAVLELRLSDDVPSEASSTVKKT